MTADSSHEGTGSQIATHRDIIADIHSGCLMMDVLVDPSEGRPTDDAVDTARYAAFLRTSTGQAILNQL